MPKWAEAWKLGLLNTLIVPGRLPTIVCMTTPWIAPEPKRPFGQGQGLLYVMEMGPVTWPVALSTSRRPGIGMRSPPGGRAGLPLRACHGAVAAGVVLVSRVAARCLRERRDRPPTGRGA